MIKKISKTKERKNGMKRLMRSNRLREGKHNGIISKAKWITTKSGKDAIRLTFEDELGRIVSVTVVPGNIHGDRIIDNILKIYGQDDAELEDIEGLKLIFEIEENGDFYNLKNVYEIDEEDDDELEEEDVLDQFEDEEEDEYFDDEELED
ncbi:hypothetical protein [uncultured Clostridium sp.]|uniref:hypothetical protein n=1 Tax=uncultured Clostridium sp. TaxID=59620 RepID=UPI0025D3CB16|nr:hypothetical protein [uncultured Clostridium sp.]